MWEFMAAFVAAFAFIAATILSTVSFFAIEASSHHSARAYDYTLVALIFGWLGIGLIFVVYGHYAFGARGNILNAYHHMLIVSLIGLFGVGLFNFLAWERLTHKDNRSKHANTEAQSETLSAWIICASMLLLALAFHFFNSSSHGAHLTRGERFLNNVIDVV